MPEAAFGFRVPINEQTVCEADKKRQGRVFASKNQNKRKPSEAEGIISPVVSVSCNYKKTTTFPDEIAISVSVLEVNQVKLKLGYTMTVGETVVCTAESVHCFLSSSGKPISIQKQFPEFYQKLCELSKGAKE